MTTVYRCDRCGEVITEKTIVEFAWMFNNYTDAVTKDLCKVCHRELVDWMKNK